jgi:subtilisin family serine protease
LNDLDILVNDSNVLSIRPYKHPKLLMDFAGGYLLSHEQKPTWNQGKFHVPRTLHEKGLTGKDIVATVLDSGVDLFHLFFYDDNQSNNAYNNLLSDHRKLKFYQAASGDQNDPQEGHGTHVSGILRGKDGDENSGISSFEGISPDSKLYFVDCQALSEDENLMIPNLYTVSANMARRGKSV